MTVNERLSVLTALTVEAACTSYSSWLINRTVKVPEELTKRDENTPLNKISTDVKDLLKSKNISVASLQLSWDSTSVIRVWCTCTKELSRHDASSIIGAFSSERDF